MTLLAKLAHYNARGVAMKWFRSYLANRMQHVQVNDDTITCDVLQDSVLVTGFARVLENLEFENLDSRSGIFVEILESLGI